MSWLVLIILIAVLLYIYVSKGHNSAEIKLIGTMEPDAQKADSDKIKKEYVNAMKAFTDKYGEPDNIIMVDDYNINRTIIVFGKEQRIVLMGRDLPFKDIISFQMTDSAGLVTAGIPKDSASDKHNYNIFVNINSLSSPVLRIYIGEKGETVNEIAGLLKVIISRNGNPRDHDIFTTGV